MENFIYCAVLMQRCLTVLTSTSNRVFYFLLANTKAATRGIQ